MNKVKQNKIHQANPGNGSKQQNNSNNNKNCWTCGLFGHKSKDCRNVAASTNKQQLVAQQRAIQSALDKQNHQQNRNAVAAVPKVEVMPHRPVKAPVTAPVTAGIPNAGVKKLKKIERTLEKTVLAEGALSNNGKFRHGRVEHHGWRTSEHGDCEVLRGTVRLDEVTVSDATPAGTILKRFFIHPSTTGPVAEAEIGLRERYRFTKVHPDFDSEIATVSTDNEGSLALAYSTNPDVVIAGGKAGIDNVSTWPNYKPIPIRRGVTVGKEMDLALRAQPPLYVGLNPDTNTYQSQGVLMLLSSTAINSDATTNTYGELYLHWECEMYTLAPEEDDVAGTVAIGYGADIASGNADFSKLTKWWGARELITCPNYGVTAVSFIVLKRGTYYVELVTYQGMAGVSVSSMPTLTYYTTAGLEEPNELTGFPLTSSKVGQFFFAADTHSGVPTEATFTKFTNDNGFQTTLSSSDRSLMTLICFACDAGQPFQFTWPVNGGGAVYQSMFRITQISTARWTAPEQRATPNVIVDGKPVLKPSLFSLLDRTITDIEPLVTDGDILKICRWVKANMAKYPVECNVLIDKLDLPLEKAATTTMILPALGAIAATLITTLGPVLAQKAVDWVADKIDGGNRVPHTKVRRHKPKKLVRYEDDDDDE